MGASSAWGRPGRRTHGRGRCRAWVAPRRRTAARRSASGRRRQARASRRRSARCVRGRYAASRRPSPSRPLNIQGLAGESTQRRVAAYVGSATLAGSEVRQGKEARRIRVVHQDAAAEAVHLVGPDRGAPGGQSRRGPRRRGSRRRALEPPWPRIRAPTSAASGATDSSAAARARLTGTFKRQVRRIVGGTERAVDHPVRPGRRAAGRRSARVRGIPVRTRGTGRGWRRPRRCSVRSVRRASSRAPRHAPSNGRSDRLARQ